MDATALSDLRFLLGLPPEDAIVVSKKEKREKWNVHALRSAEKSFLWLRLGTWHFGTMDRHGMREAGFDSTMLC